MSLNKKILFVCMGNICRSPSAEGIFRQLASEEKGLTHLEIDSCGTIGYHVGNPPDPRSVKAAKDRGYDLSAIRSRKIAVDDLVHYDYLLAMDDDNLSDLHSLADGDNELIRKCVLFLDYAKENSTRCVPDPYYGGERGFDVVIDLVEEASRGLILELLR